jgi:hypothetical protein
MHDLVDTTVLTPIKDGPEPDPRQFLHPITPRITSRLLREFSGLRQCIEGVNEDLTKLLTES